MSAFFSGSFLEFSPSRDVWLEQTRNWTASRCRRFHSVRERVAQSQTQYCCWGICHSLFYFCLGTHPVNIPYRRNNLSFPLSFFGNKGCPTWILHPHLFSVFWQIIWRIFWSITKTIKEPITLIIAVRMFEASPDSERVFICYMLLMFWLWSDDFLLLLSERNHVREGGKIFHRAIKKLIGIFTTSSKTTYHLPTIFKKQYSITLYFYW